MTSKAQQWYEAQVRVQRSHEISKGVWANVVIIPESGPHLELKLENVHAMPTAAEALAFGRWIIAEFGEGEAKG